MNVDDVHEAIELIAANKGNPPACARFLSRKALAKAMHSWFGHGDLAAAKQWFYVSANAKRLSYDLAVGPQNNGLGYDELLMALISDHEEMVRWCANCDALFDASAIEDVASRDFFAYQYILALRGDWQRLASRCERLLAARAPNNLQHYLIDQLFFQALAAGDMQHMQAVIGELVSERQMDVRRDDEGAFTQHLISTAAVIFAKLAWRHGYQVAVPSPYIPAEWLPVSPLARYDKQYACLR